MAKLAIPETVRQQVEEIVAQFNKSELNSKVYYVASFRGKHLYLARHSYGRSGPICRLTYDGAMNNWEFAIYKYSDNGYDPDEWFFPGSEHLNGTIEGALRAGLQAYPP